MANMPRPRLPNVRAERTRHGKIAYYYRPGDGPRTRIRGEYGSPEFLASYRSALAGAPAGCPSVGTATLSWLIKQYQTSPAWNCLSTATRSQRESIFKRVCKTAGERPFKAITPTHIKQGVADRASTPFAANDFLKAMRKLFDWAVKSDFITIDPTKGVAGYAPKTEGHHTWTEEEIWLFEMRWSVGTRERLAFAILLFTGLRRGDAAILGRQHIKDGVMTFRTTKTGETVTIPLLPELAAVIEASPTGDLAFMTAASGATMAAKTFGNWFRQACDAAGVPGSAHGLRKAAATRFANAGCTEAELEAIFGWHGGHMASLYTRKADRAKLARSAVSKLQGSR